MSKNLMDNFFQYEGRSKSLAALFFPHDVVTLRRRTMSSCFTEDYISQGKKYCDDRTCISCSLNEKVWKALVPVRPIVRPPVSSKISTGKISGTLHTRLILPLATIIFSLISKRSWVEKDLRRGKSSSQRWIVYCKIWVHSSTVQALKNSSLTWTNASIAMKII